MQSGQREVIWWDLAQWTEREWGHTHYLNEPSLYELLVSGKKAMIDLREDHLSRCVRSRGRRSEVREGWRRMKSQRRKKKEEEGKCKQKQILLERPVFMNSGPAPSQMGGEIHTFPAPRWFVEEVWAYFFGDRARNYHLWGASAPQRVHSPLEKWELLLRCESAVIIIVVSAAKSDPGSCTHWNLQGQPLGVEAYF